MRNGHDRIDRPQQPAHPDRDQAAPPVAPARGQLRRRQPLRAAARVPARALALGRGEGPRSRPGDAGARQAERRPEGHRAGRASTRCAWCSTTATTAGLYSWKYLHELGRDRERLWARYLERCATRAERAARPTDTMAVPPQDPMNAPSDDKKTDPFRLPGRALDREGARACAACSTRSRRKYDLMNDLMSGGMHRLWKRFTLSQTGLRPGQRALDVAGGTGDLAARHGAAGRRPRPGGAHRHQRARCSRAAATGCSTPASSATRLRAGQRREAALRRRELRLRDHRLRPAQRHRQARGAGVDAPRAAARRAAAGAGVLAAGRARPQAASTTSIRSACCRCSAGWWPATPRATATWPSPSACTRTRRPCSA